MKKHIETSVERTWDKVKKQGAGAIVEMQNNLSQIKDLLVSLEVELEHLQ